MKNGRFFDLEMPVASRGCYHQPCRQIRVNEPLFFHRTRTPKDRVSLGRRGAYAGSEDGARRQLSFTAVRS